jgi:hypothetical protein
MTPLEALAVDWVKAKLAQDAARSRYARHLQKLSYDSETEESFGTTSEEYKKLRKEQNILEAAIISHVKAAYEQELKQNG